jgi:hypothetical protein
LDYFDLPKYFNKDYIVGIIQHQTNPFWNYRLDLLWNYLVKASPRKLSYPHYITISHPFSWDAFSWLSTAVWQNIHHFLVSLSLHMIYFDSDMSKSTNTVVYFDWKTVIYIYVCGKCRTQFMLPMEKSVAFNGTCANEIIPNG